MLSRDPSVGEAYAKTTRWSGTAAGNGSTLRSVPGEPNEAVDAGPGFGELPLLYIHGELSTSWCRWRWRNQTVRRLAGDLAPRSEIIAEGESDETLTRAGRGSDDRVGGKYAERVTADG